AEDDGKDHHREERADEGPCGADHGLLVAHGHVAPRQHPEQLAIGPQIAPVMAVGPAPFDDKFVHRGILTLRYGKPETAARQTPASRPHKHTGRGPFRRVDAPSW